MARSASSAFNFTLQSAAELFLEFFACAVNSAADRSDRTADDFRDFFVLQSLNLFEYQGGAIGFR